MIWHTVHYQYKTNRLAIDVELARFRSGWCVWVHSGYPRETRFLGQYKTRRRAYRKGHQFVQELILSDERRTGDTA